MRRLLACLVFILLLVAPISYEFTGQRQVFNLFQQTQFKGMLLSSAQSTEVLYFAISNIFYKTFDEPFESIIFLTWKGTVVLYTNHLSNTVGAPLDVLKVDLKPTGEDLTDVILVVHNHFGSPFFSHQGRRNDMRYFYNLKRNGFNGVFALWDTSQNKMVKRLPKK